MNTGESEQRELHSPGGLAVAKVRHTKWVNPNESQRPVDLWAMGPGPAAAEGNPR